MNTTIDELAAEVVSSDSEQQRKQRQVHCPETQLESHTSRGVPGTAALMQRNVIRGLRHESGRRVGSAGKDIAADGYYVGLVLESRDGCLYETDDWVETHFEKSFIRAVKRQSLDKDGGFFSPGFCGFTPVQVNIVVASVDGHMADDQVRTSSKVAQGTPKCRSL